MKKRIVYTDEPMSIGRRVSWDEIVARHGGARRGAGRPSSGNKPLTIRLPEDLLRDVRAEAARREITISEYVASRLKRRGPK
jgi:hypothetical protein